MQQGGQVVLVNRLGFDLGPCLSLNAWGKNASRIEMYIGVVPGYLSGGMRR